MPNATWVYIVGTSCNGNYIFQAFNKRRTKFYVISFINGIVTIEPMMGTAIRDFAELVVNCFEKKSTFIDKVSQVFNCPKNNVLKGINFEFNDVNILVTKEDADVNKICAKYEAGLEANARKARLELEAYKKTDEYRLARAKTLKCKIRKEKVREEVLDIDKTTQLEFKDEEEKEKWNNWVKDNSYPFFNCYTMKYARLWGKYMQHIMSKHNKTVANIAENTFDLVDMDGITGFIYGCVVDILSQCWKHGEELRRWHNKKYNKEDIEGVVNPAILGVKPTK